MTAIIAIRCPDTGTGAMVAESGLSGHVNTRSRPKIRQVGSAFIASSGALSGGQFVDQKINALLQGGFAQGLPGAAWVMAGEWREWCVDRGHHEQQDGLRRYPSHFLILSPHGLFEICTDGEVLHHPPETRYAAIGNGATVCIGAAHALLSCEPGAVDARAGWYEAVATYAVEAAIDLCDGCAAPVQVEVLEPPPPPPPPPPEPDAQLGAQLLILIEVNYIDRAIKLCSRAGRDPFVVACKAMLLQANQGEQAIRSALAKHVDAVPQSQSVPLVTVRDALLERAR